MEERKEAAYEYISKCLFSASEYLNEAADTMDIENINLDEHTIRTIAAEIERKAQQAQRIRNEAKKGHFVGVTYYENGALCSAAAAYRHDTEAEAKAHFDELAALSFDELNDLFKIWGKNEAERKACAYVIDLNENLETIEQKAIKNYEGEL